MTNIIHRRRAERSRRKNPEQYETAVAAPVEAPTPEVEEEEVEVVAEEPKTKKRNIWSRTKKS